MFSMKSEPFETVGVGNDSQGIEFMDDNSHINGPINMSTPDSRPDKSYCKEMILTLAYVKTEPNTSASQYNTAYSDENVKNRTKHISSHIQHFKLWRKRRNSRTKYDEHKSHKDGEERRRHRYHDVCD